MDTLDDWFAYPKYRPHQREMLERAAVCARDGGIAMIDVKHRMSSSGDTYVDVKGVRAVS